MFIGHLAVGFAGKRFAPRMPLAALLFAGMFADILGSALVAAGIERVRIIPGATDYSPLEFTTIPWSHSLLTLIVWSALIAVGLSAGRSSAKPSLVIVALVLSHWILDWITHLPDMPIYPGGEGYGLGLWNNAAATMILEIAIFAAGVWIYGRTTRAGNRIGRWAFAGLVGMLLALYVLDAFFPPGSVTELWVSNLVGSTVILAWAAWIDRHRSLRLRAVNPPFSGVPA